MSYIDDGSGGGGESAIVFDCVGDVGGDVNVGDDVGAVVLI